MVERGNGGYVDWIIIVIHGLRKYLDLPYRRLLDVLQEMHGIAGKMNLGPSELPDFTTVAFLKPRGNHKKREKNPKRVCNRFRMYRPAQSFFSSRKVGKSNGRKR